MYLSTNVAGCWTVTPDDRNKVTPGSCIKVIHGDGSTVTTVRRRTLQCVCCNIILPREIRAVTHNGNGTLTPIGSSRITLFGSSTVSFGDSIRVTPFGCIRVISSDSITVTHVDIIL
jgi:hypothetical protein